MTEAALHVEPYGSHFRRNSERKPTASRIGSKRTETRSQREAAIVRRRHEALTE
jgi:hypothetical protein